MLRFPLCNGPDFNIFEKPYRGVLKHTIYYHTYSYDNITLNMLHICLICDNSANISGNYTDYLLRMKA